MKHLNIEHISVLGSTGSIGRQALDIAQHLGLRVEALAANRSVGLLEEQARKFRPRLLAVFDEKAAAELRVKLRDLPIKIAAGPEGVCEAASFSGTELVLNAVVGIAGLKPTIAAIEAKKRVALANKETLVAGGDPVMRLAKQNGVEILPVDSEHSAIFQCLQGNEKHVKKLLLTASGGPFFGCTRAQLEAVTPEQALCHPNWKMGPKITVDCATLMNKGLELIEAVRLFGVSPKQVEVVVHRESVVHSMVEFTDNSILAQLGPHDMRLPIQYAITWPERFPSPVGELDFAAVAKLTFYQPDSETFPCLRLCRRAAEEDGLLPAAANAANEEAVGLFLNNRIGFTEIPELVEEAMNTVENRSHPISVEDILSADAQAREIVRSRVRP